MVIDTSDRRIQVKDGLYNLLVAAAARRFVSPSAFASMVLAAYLKTEGELAPTLADEAKPMLTRASLPSKETLAAWEDDDEDD